MSAINRELPRLLDGVKRPGDFYATGRFNVFLPRIKVSGIGTLSLPLPPEQARQLVALAEQAPYGRGPDTLVDTDVRRTWQVDAGQVSLEGSHWESSLQEIVGRAAAGLGVADPVSAQLYKLLIYDTGSFFVSHRDTEKAPGMFATLVLILPSEYAGGELVIRHRDREVCLDLSSREASEVAYAAFYADCLHEVRPVSAGYRLALIYNLVRTGAGKPPEPPSNEAEVEAVSRLLQSWAAKQEEELPAKLIYPLEHVYTEVELAFPTLKNGDAAKAAVMKAAAEKAGCELQLALVSIQESGSAEYVSSGRRRYYGQWDDELEADEVFERTLLLEDWVRPDGSRPELGAMPFDDEELCPLNAFEGQAPDEQFFQEAAGNEGASFERTYRRTAFVLWPLAGRLHIIAGAGLPTSLPYLESLVRKPRASSRPEDKEEARILATRMLDYWVVPPRSATLYGFDQAGGAARMLACLVELEDRQAIAAFLARVTAQGQYGDGDNEVLAAAFRLLSPEPAAALLKDIVAANGVWQSNACANLLLRVSSDWSAAPGLLLPAAAALVATLAAEPAPAYDYRRQPVKAELIPDLLGALKCLGAETLADQMLDRLLAETQASLMDEVLVPAAVAIVAGDGDVAAWPPTERLRRACLAHLERRLAEPLEPPRDHARACDIACNCEHCRELAAFMADPKPSVWNFRAAERFRQHVETSLRLANCDAGWKTERRGSPHTLVVTKNQASFDRRVEQRRQDIEHRASLLPAAGSQ